MRTLLVLLAIAVVALPYGSSAQIPRTISFQGVLSDTMGRARPDGTYQFTFRLYSAPVLSKAIWAEPDKSLEVKRGLFSTQLGSEVPFGALVDFQKQYWLGIEVGSEGELSPRMPLSSVAYGFRSINADTSDIAMGVADTSIATSKLKNSAVTSAKIAPAQVVKSINTLKDSVTLLAGANVSITPSGNTLTIAASGGGGGGVSGGGASAQLTFWTGSSTVGGDNGLVWDNAGKMLGIGVTPMYEKLHVYGTDRTAIHAESADNYGVFAQCLQGSYAGVFGEGQIEGVAGMALDSNAAMYGVYGEARSRYGYGVFGANNNSAGGIAVCGQAIATAGLPIGVKGLSTRGYGVYGLSGEGIGVMGRSTLSSGVAYGVEGVASSTDGSGVYGQSPVRGVWGMTTEGSAWAAGVDGMSSSTSGCGVHGEASASSGATFGAYGLASSSSGHGVYGFASASSGSTYGVYGVASSSTGYGVYGESPTRGVWGFSSATTGWAVGTYGACASTSGYGVYGAANATSGTTYGVVGYNLSPTGYGVYGYAGASSGETRGVMGVCTSPAGAGVYGLSSATGGSTWGTFGKNESTEGAGAVGWSSSTSGNTFGVWGLSDSPSGRAVYGDAAGGGTAVYCDGKFYQTGGVFEAHPTSVVWSGTKPATVKLNNGTRVKLFTEEAAELYFTDYGEGRLSGGRAHVELDGTFLQTVTIDTRHPMKAFVQLEGDCRGVYVANKTATGFDVVELQGGRSNASFSYRVVCKRKYYEDERLATEEQDVMYNTRMLESVWPEVVAERQEGQKGRRAMQERHLQMRAQDLRNPENPVGPQSSTGR
jgi:hypothetical protein